MPFVSRRAQLKLSKGDVEILAALSQSRNEAAWGAQRASILLRYHGGDTISEIVKTLANEPATGGTVCEQNPGVERGSSVGRLAGARPPPGVDAGSACVGSLFGVPEAKRSGLCARTLDLWVVIPYGESGGKNASRQGFQASGTLH